MLAALITAVAVHLLVWFVPGAFLLLLAGARLSIALAAGPLITLGVVTASTTVADLVPVDWSPWTFAAAVLVAVVAVLGVRAATGTPPRAALSHIGGGLRTRSWRDLAAAASVLAAGVFGASVIGTAMGDINRAHQDWDYIFHANAVRYIADTGDASPGGVTTLIDWESATTYYPNTYHALEAVVFRVSGVTIFDTLNVQTMLIPLLAAGSLAVLLRELKAPLTVVLVTPVALVGFASFPYDALWRGPLLPYSTGVALIPALAVLFLWLIRERSWAGALMAALGTAALLGTQTATGLSAALVVLALLVQRWLTEPSALRRDVPLLGASVAAAVVVGLPAVIGSVRTGTAGATVDWPAVESPGQAAGDLFLLNHASPAPQYWLAGLMVIGLLTLPRARYMWWWLAGGAVFLGLFVMAAASDSALVQAVTRPWWNDRWRFAALAVLAFAPLAAHGFHVLARGVAGVLPLGGPGLRAQRVRLAAVAAAGLLALVVLSNGLYAPTNEERMAAPYRSDQTLSPEEVQAMAWLSDQPGAYDGTVMNDVNDGSSYMLATEGLHPVFGHVIAPGSVMGPRQTLLLDHFNCLDSDEAVREVIREKDIRYVFVGSGFVRQGWQRVAGLHGLSASPSLELVYSGGSGVFIYRVDLQPQLSTSPLPACTAGGGAS